VVAVAKVGFICLAQAGFPGEFFFIFQRASIREGGTLFSKLPAIATSTPYLRNDTSYRQTK
jgi:hypothetical protein